MPVEERRERRREEEEEKEKKEEDEGVEGRTSTEGMRSPRGVAEDHTESRARSWLVGGPYFDFPPSPFAAVSCPSRSFRSLLRLPLHNCDLLQCRYRKVMKGKRRRGQYPGFSCGIIRLSYGLVLVVVVVVHSPRTQCISEYLKIHTK